jgi:hypothetical protein
MRPQQLTARKKLSPRGTQLTSTWIPDQENQRDSKYLLFEAPS